MQDTPSGLEIIPRCTECVWHAQSSIVRTCICTLSVSRGWHTVAAAIPPTAATTIFWPSELAGLAAGAGDAAAVVLAMAPVFSFSLSVEMC